jgi:VWFA-related protein
VLALVAVALPLDAQEGQPPAPSDLLLRGGTQEVLLDFIVRDKHQKLVKNLRPEEVQIFEDGVRQDMRSFVFRDGRRPVPGRPAPSAPETKGVGRAASASDPLREINLVTLVFEGMSPLSRRTAVERAQEFLNADVGPNTYMAVYSLFHQLSALQPYTTDIGLLRKAVDRAGSGAYDQFAKDNLELVERLNSLEAHGPGGPSANASSAATYSGGNSKASSKGSGGAGSGDAGNQAERFQPFDPGAAEERGPQNDAWLASIETRNIGVMLDTLFRQQGMRSIDALRSLIRAQARLPGRKTVLLFSEGLAIPPNEPELLDSVIGEANRSNVSFIPWTRAASRWCPICASRLRQAKPSERRN